MGDDRISGQAVKKGTGHDWDHWFALIDSFGPLPDHAARAKALADAVPDLSGWWVQSVVIQFERKRHLRVVGQSSAGDFQVTCSKTIYSNLDEAWAKLMSVNFFGFGEWIEGAEHQVEGARIEVRRVAPGKMLRWFWFEGDAKTTVEVDFQVKEGRTAVRFMHHGFPTKVAASAYRARWKAVLDDLESAA